MGKCHSMNRPHRVQNRSSFGQAALEHFGTEGQDKALIGTLPFYGYTDPLKGCALGCTVAEHFGGYRGADVYV